jgi:hypothetical protein
MGGVGQDSSHQPAGSVAGARIEDQILAWFAHGECGISSAAMARAIVGQAPDARFANGGNHPCDPSDFGRCVKLLDAVPAARQRLAVVAALSPIWARLIQHWDALEALYRRESPSGAAPVLYQRMKALGC